jgi:hypothetical protein
MNTGYIIVLLVALLCPINMWLMMRRKHRYGQMNHQEPRQESRPV